MIETLFAHCIRHRAIVILASLATAAAGAWAMLHTPVDAAPDLAETTVTLIAEWKGQSRQQVEEHVTRPLSAIVQSLDGVKTVRGTSSPGGATLCIAWNDGVDPHVARQRALEELSLATEILPEGVSTHLAPDGGGGEIFFYTVEGDGHNVADLREVQQQMARVHLRSVAGVATVATLGDGKQSTLEKAGRDAVGGVVQMRRGENPLEVIEAIRRKIGEIRPDLPEGVRIVPFYDRSRIVEGTIGSMRKTLAVQILLVCTAIALVVQPLRSALVVCLTLPAAVCAAFLMMRLRAIPADVMSLSGIALSVGMLADTSIVVADQVLCRLRQHFGDEREVGDRRSPSTSALESVGRPVFLAALLVVVSFLPIFALSDVSGRLVEPLAYARTFAVASAAIFGFTLAPALAAVLIRGRVGGEDENWLVRQASGFCRPTAKYLLDHPWPAVWATSALLLVGLAPAVGRDGPGRWAYAAIVAWAMLATAWAVGGEERSFGRRWRVAAALWTATTLGLVVWLNWDAAARSFAAPKLGANRATLVVIFGALLMAAGAIVAALACGATWLAGRGRVLATGSMIVSLLLVAAAARRGMAPLEYELTPPLDDSSAIDLQVSLPPEREGKASDDLKALDAMLLQFPEVEMAVGEVQRDDAGSNEAPVEKLEMLVRLRPEELWLKRELRYDDPRRQTRAALAAMDARGWVHRRSADKQNTTVNDATIEAMAKFDEAMRGMALAGRAEIEATLSNDAAQAGSDHAATRSKLTRELNWKLLDAAGPAYTWLAIEALRDRVQANQDWLAGDLPAEDLQKLRAELEAPFSRELLLWRKTKGNLVEDMNTAARASRPGVRLDLPAVDRFDVLGMGTLPGGGATARGDRRDEVQSGARETGDVGVRGSNERALRVRKELSAIFAVVVVIIFLILYVVYYDFADALVVMALTIPSAIAGGALMQRLLGVDFGVATSVGFIASLGLSAKNGLMALMPLRDAVAQRGGLEKMSRADVKKASLEGATNRMRPRLLIALTAFAGLGPMLWATGPGAEIVRALAAPLLGGLLASGFVVEMLLPPLFFRVRRWRWKRLHGGPLVAKGKATVAQSWHAAATPT